MQNITASVNFQRIRNVAIVGGIQINLNKNAEAFLPLSFSIRDKNGIRNVDVDWANASTPVSRPMASLKSCFSGAVDSVVLVTLSPRSFPGAVTAHRN